MTVKTPVSQDQPLARVRRVRDQVENQRHENELLKQQLAREQRETKATGRLTVGKDMNRLQDQADMYAGRIEQERARIAALDNHIATTQALILAQRKKMGGADASKENNDMIGKQVRVLENRLDKSLVKFNEALAANKQLRAKIDRMRQERVVFDGIYKKLERELHEKKKEMSAIIEDSNNAYQARDKAQSEMEALKKQAEKDKKSFEDDWRELGQMIESDRKLREKLRAETEKTAQGMSPTNAMFGSRVSETGSPVEMLESELRQGSTGGAIGWPVSEKKVVNLTINKMKTYEESFAKIEDATGISDVDEIVTKFLEAEDKNFSLFNYVNELNSEIERLELMISDTKGEIEACKGAGVSNDTQKKQILRNLDERLLRTSEKVDEYEARYTNAMKTINQLKASIHSIFSRIGCASTSVEEMLGNQGVTESNMMQYLGIIEQRTSEILQHYAKGQQQGGNPIRVGGEGMLDIPTNGVAPSHGKLSVVPPAYDEISSGEDSEEDDDERPLTRDELQRKTLRGLRKQEKSRKHK